MEPKPPPRTELPDLISSDSVPTLQRQQQGNTLPSAKIKVASDPPLPVVPPPQITMPSGPQAQFRPPPSMQALGGEILEWTPPQLIRARFPAHDGWTNNNGTLSPGFIVAMFDPIYSALAGAVAAQRQSAIIETSVRFFRSIRGGYVMIDGTVVRAGRTTATVECIASDTSGELCAKGSATLMLIG